MAQLGVRIDDRGIGSLWNGKGLWIRKGIQDQRILRGIAGAAVALSLASGWGRGGGEWLGAWGVAGTWGLRRGGCGAYLR